MVQTLLRDLPECNAADYVEMQPALVSRKPIKLFERELGSYLQLTVDNLACALVYILTESTPQAVSRLIGD